MASDQEEQQQQQPVAPLSDAGSAVYSPLLLSIYDAVVLGFSNTYVWRCPTDEVLLPLFESAMGEHHLDVGVGTGYFPATAMARRGGGAASSSSPPCRSLTLVDANPTALDTARRRVHRAAAGLASSSSPVRVSAVLADATKPLPLSVADGPSQSSATGGRGNDDGGDNSGCTRNGVVKFTSASIFYLLHCISLPAETKATLVLDSLRAHLAPDATLVGATILGRGRDEHRGWLARGLGAFYNRRGIFSNADDGAEAFERVLRRVFAHVEVWFVGVVMLFRARGLRVAVGPLEALPTDGEGI
ncbi:hypothetical protein JDV02_002981 [Purpureocillium takamizusanense]|uniref:Methyltransferase domain-containing protein n=1 Tax=Purpureocillium takamizusanense TaxID=2060973 RepID=A0A9Q8QBI0_9HYPO|nr:uncharacterized protein JDV02_002981 [Purpureocillium takamizusanense]UNI16555.1 hypothetical protein JDV02_002981 [Purpureocillium takamizusanense]